MIKQMTNYFIQLSLYIMHAISICQMPSCCIPDPDVLKYKLAGKKRWVLNTI